jgi:diacylglycerol kinase (ATP)
VVEPEAVEQQTSGTIGDSGRLPECEPSEQMQPGCFRRLYVVINPAAGQQRPVVSELNAALQDTGIDWDIGITKELGDGQALAAQAIAAGADVVAAYGGDGTVMDVATALLGTGIPLAILPGGTANVMAMELGIPGDTAGACRLLMTGQVRAIDFGRLGAQHFLLRVGIGAEAVMVKEAARELKERFGRLAYALTAIRALREAPHVRFLMNIDGQEIISEGVTCFLANSGNLGMPNLQLSSIIRVDDGRLDVVVVRAADLNSLISITAGVLTGNEEITPLQHWQGSTITISADPPQPVIYDGELWGATPVSVETLPGAIHVIVPRDPGPAAEA